MDVSTRELLSQYDESLDRHREIKERMSELKNTWIVVFTVFGNVPHYWVLGGYGWVHGAEITKQRQLLTNTLNMIN